MRADKQVRVSSAFNSYVLKSSRLVDGILSKEPPKKMACNDMRPMAVNGVIG